MHGGLFKFDDLCPQGFDFGQSRLPFVVEESVPGRVSGHVCAPQINPKISGGVVRLVAVDVIHEFGVLDGSVQGNGHYKAMLKYGESSSAEGIINPVKLFADGNLTNADVAFHGVEFSARLKHDPFSFLASRIAQRTDAGEPPGNDVVDGGASLTVTFCFAGWARYRNVCESLSLNWKNANFTPINCRMVWRLWGIGPGPSNKSIFVAIPRERPFPNSAGRVARIAQAVRFAPIAFYAYDPEPGRLISERRIPIYGRVFGLNFRAELFGHRYTHDQVLAT